MSKVTKKEINSIASAFKELPLVCTKCFFRKRCQVKEITKTKKKRDVIQTSRPHTIFELTVDGEVQSYTAQQIAVKCCERKLKAFINMFDEPEKGGLRID